MSLLLILYRRRKAGAATSFTALSSTGAIYTTSQVVLSSTGIGYTVPQAVLSSTGAIYNPI